MTDNELAIERLENIKTKVESIGDSVAIDVAISALKGGWIPVEEREPDLMKEVWLSLRSLEVVKGWRSETEFHGEQCYYICGGGEYVVSSNVLAWQPLPEPYKKEV